MTPSNSLCSRSKQAGHLAQPTKKVLCNSESGSEASVHYVSATALLSNNITLSAADGVCC
jgi:hypothetical protein